MIIASIMTGTSVDGVDVAFVDVNKNEISNFFSFDFTKAEKKYIEKFLWPTNAKLNEIAAFNFEFSRIVAKHFNKIPLKVRNTTKHIVYHGQTVFHDPNAKISEYSNTLQLGNGGVLSQLIKKNVICDVRSTDVANGQNGAPLVGFGDKELFWNKKNGLLVFNIGGISNVTAIDKKGIISQFDLGPGNALIDAYVKKHFNVPYDANGKIASEGKVIQSLLKKLNEDKFLSIKPPKSTGKEIYNIEYINKLIGKNNFDKKDVVATLTKFTSDVLGTTKDFLNIKDYDVLLAGGGIKNKTLFNFLKKEFPNIKSTSELGVDPQARECASFAYLGKFYLEEIKNGTGPIKSIFGCMYKY